MEEKVVQISIPSHLHANSFRVLSETRIFLVKLNLEVDLIKHFFIINSFSLAADLIEKCNAVFSNEEEEIYVSLSSLKINVQTGEELYVLKEIFINNVYGFFPVKESMVIDIGMNVGITSLVFSLQPNIKRIFGFEPFAGTFAQANKNFKMNQPYSEKITAIHAGLGNQKKTLELDYVKEFKANMSTTYATAHLPDWGERVRTTVEILDAKDELQDIIRSNKELYKILKIDCEGAEYEIMERLDGAGLLKEIDAVMLEWHFRGAPPLVARLKKNEFNVLSFDPEYGNTGMIYGFK